MASNQHTISFFKIPAPGSRGSIYDAYNWGEGEMKRILKDALSYSGAPLVNRYAILSRYANLSPDESKDSERLVYGYGNVICDYLARYYDIDRYIERLRYSMPIVSHILVLTPPTAGPYTMGSRVEIRNLPQGIFDKEAFVRITTKPIEAPSHVLPNVSTYCPVLGANNSAVKLILGPVTMTSTDTNYTIVDAQKTALVVVMISLHFTRNGRVVPPNTVAQNSLVYFDEPNIALVKNITLRNNVLSTSTSFPQMTNLMLAGTMKPEIKRQYQQYMQASTKTSITQYLPTEAAGLPDLSMGEEFTLKSAPAHDENQLCTIDGLMTSRFNPGMNMTMDMPLYARSDMEIETGPTAPKTAHPSYTFGHIINTRVAQVPENAPGRYSYSSEHRQYIVDLAPAHDVINFTPSNVKLTVRSRMGLITPDGATYWPVVDNETELPYTMISDLPAFKIDTIDIIQNTIDIPPVVRDELIPRPMLTETNLYTEEIIVDTPKEAANSVLVPTRNTSVLEAYMILVPQAEKVSPASRHLTWARTGLPVILPNIKHSRRICTIGGSTAPFTAADIKSNFIEKRDHGMMPGIQLNAGSAAGAELRFKDQEHIEMLTNPLGRSVEYNKYTWAGYRVATYCPIKDFSVSLQNIIHMRSENRNIEAMGRVFVPDSFTDRRIDNCIIIPTTYHGACVKKLPGGVNFGKITGSRIEVHYDMAVLKKTDTTTVRFTIVHAGHNVRQTVSMMSMNAFHTN